MIKDKIVCHSSRVPPSRRSRRDLQCLFHHCADSPPWTATYTQLTAWLFIFSWNWRNGSRKCPFQSLDLQKLQVSAFVDILDMVPHQLQKVIVSDNQWWIWTTLLSCHIFNYFPCQSLLPSPMSFIHSDTSLEGQVETKIKIFWF